MSTPINNNGNLPPVVLDNQAEINLSQNAQLPNPVDGNSTLERCQDAPEQNAPNSSEQCSTCCLSNAIKSFFCGLILFFSFGLINLFPKKAEEHTEEQPVGQEQGEENRTMDSEQFRRIMDQLGQNQAPVGGAPTTGTQDDTFVPRIPRTIAEVDADLQELAAQIRELESESPEQSQALERARLSHFVLSALKEQLEIEEREPDAHFITLEDSTTGTQEQGSTTSVQPQNELTQTDGSSLNDNMSPDQLEALTVQLNDSQLAHQALLASLQADRDESNAANSQSTATQEQDPTTETLSQPPGDPGTLRHLREQLIDVNVDSLLNNQGVEEGEGKDGGSTFTAKDMNDDSGRKLSDQVRAAANLQASNRQLRDDFFTPPEASEGTTTIKVEEIVDEKLPPSPTESNPEPVMPSSSSAPSAPLTSLPSTDIEEIVDEEKKSPPSSPRQSDSAQGTPVASPPPTPKLELKDVRNVAYSLSAIVGLKDPAEIFAGINAAETLDEAVSDEHLAQLKNKQLKAGDFDSSLQVQLFAKALSESEIVPQQSYTKLAKQGIKETDYRWAFGRIEGQSKLLFRNCINIIRKVMQHKPKLTKELTAKLADALLAKVPNRTPEQNQRFNDALIAIVNSNKLFGLL